jgi:outer membrane protein
LTAYNGALYSGSLSATQTLFDIGAFAQAYQSGKTLQGAKAGEAGARQLLAFNVKQAYYNVVKARKTVQADQAAVDQSTEQEKLTAEMKRVGSAALVDLLKFQVQLSQSKTDLLTAQNGEAVARASLCAAMGIDVNSPVQVIDSVSYEAQAPNLQDLMAKARKQRPDIAQARATLAVYGAASNASKGQYLPRLSASLGYSYRDPNFPQSWQYVKDRYTWSTGISASWTIFDGLITQANIRTAGAQKASAEAALRAAEEAADVDVKQSYLNYTLQLDKVKLAEETLTEAEESYRLTNEKYRLGAASTLDLLTSQTTLTQARVQEASTLGDLKTAEAALSKALGE